MVTTRNRAEHVVVGEELTGVGGVAKRLGVRPSQVTALFYECRLRDDLCPVVSGNRVIPTSYIPIIAMELRRKGIALLDCLPETRAEGNG